MIFQHRYQSITSVDNDSNRLYLKLSIKTVYNQNKLYEWATEQCNKILNSKWHGARQNGSADQTNTPTLLSIHRQNMCIGTNTHTHTSKRERAQKKTKKKYLYKCNLNNQSVLTRNGVEVFSAMYCGFSDLKRLKFDDKALFIKCKTSEQDPICMKQQQQNARSGHCSLLPLITHTHIHTNKHPSIQNKRIQNTI